MTASSKTVCSYGDAPSCDLGRVATRLESQDVVDDSPAAKAGVHAGDVVVRYDGKIVDNPRDFSAMVANTPVGKTVELTVVRSGKVEPVRVVIGNLAGSSIAQASDESRPAGRLGLAFSN